MKKYLLLTLVIASLLLFQGCGKSDSTSSNDGASKVVETFMNQMCELNIEDAYACINLTDEIPDFEEIGEDPILESIFAKIKYEISDSKVDGDTATVTLNVTHIKSADILETMQQAMMSLDQDMLVKLLEEDDDASEDLMNDAIIEKIDELETEETEIVFNLEKIDDKWLIKDDNDFSFIFGDLVSE